MSKENYISKKESSFLFLTVFFAFFLRVINFVVSVYFTEPDPNEFGIYHIFDMNEIMSPVYSFIVFLTCLFLVWRIHPATIIFSSFLSLILAIFFGWWLIDTQQIIAYAAKVNPNYEFKTFDFLLISGSIYDAITLFVVNFLLFWQISILLRMLIKTSQRKIELP